MDVLFDWISAHEPLGRWLLVFSVTTFIITLLLVPLILACLPQDYFVSRNRRRLPWVEQHPITRITLLLLKNLVGAILVLTGVIMLVLPGQGILTIMAGLVLVDFPGKFHLERWIISQRSMLKAINWIRDKSGIPHLIEPLEKS